MMRRRVAGCWLLLAGCGFAAALLGCRKEGPKLVGVEGKVIYDKKPLTTGYVILHPDRAKGNTSLEQPSGVIDAHGNYQIMTGAKSGAAPGWYKVAVSAAEQKDPNNPYFQNWLIPEKYISPETSKLAYEVVEQPAPAAYDLVLDKKQVSR